MSGMLGGGKAGGGLCSNHCSTKFEILGGFSLQQHDLESKACGISPMQILSVIGGVVKVEETDLKSRVGFLYPIETHNISLFINASREQDSGQYMCTVNVVDDIIRMHKNVGLINLTVLGKAPPVPLAPLELPMVSPSTNICAHSATSHPHLPAAWQRRRGGQRDLELLLQEGEALALVPVAAPAAHPAGLLSPCPG